MQDNDTIMSQHEFPRFFTKQEMQVEELPNTTETLFSSETVGDAPNAEDLTCKANDLKDHSDSALSGVFSLVACGFMVLGMYQADKQSITVLPVDICPEQNVLPSASRPSQTIAASPQRQMPKPHTDSIRREASTRIKPTLDWTAKKASQTGNAIAGAASSAKNSAVNAWDYVWGQLKPGCR